MSTNKVETSSNLIKVFSSTGPGIEPTTIHMVSGRPTLSAMLWYQSEEVMSLGKYSLEIRPALLANINMWWLSVVGGAAVAEVGTKA